MLYLALVLWIYVLIPFVIIMEINDRLEIRRWAARLRKQGCWSEEDIEYISKAGNLKDF